MQGLAQTQYQERAPSVKDGERREERMRCPMPRPRFSSGTAKYQNHESRGRGYTMVSPSSSSPSRYPRTPAASRGRGAAGRPRESAPRPETRFRTASGARDRRRILVSRVVRSCRGDGEGGEGSAREVFGSSRGDRWRVRAHETGVERSRPFRRVARSTVAKGGEGRRSETEPSGSARTNPERRSVPKWRAKTGAQRRERAARFCGERPG